MKETTPKSTINLSESILPFDVDSLTQGIRVKPAVFARMMNVSKQAVSQWIKVGKIALYQDGTLDPRKAAQQIIDNSDPARIRAKVFKMATDDAAKDKEKIDELENEVSDLNAKLEDAQLRIEYLDMLVAECGESEYQLQQMILTAIPKIKETDIELLPEFFDSLFDEAILEAGRVLGLRE